MKSSESLFLTVTFYATLTNSTNAANGPIIVELFTSQGCSSCPPADAAMNQLAENPNFIPLSYHVTYWDHLNWKDTLGRKSSDGRQRGYVDYKRSSRMYTPQMIINGGKDFVGSRLTEAEHNLSHAKPVSNITISGMTPNGTIISLPQLTSGNYYIWVAGVKDSHSEKIKRGENRGKMVTYTNSVMSLEKAENWNGNAKTITIKLNKKANIDHYVIFAQSKGYGEITAAGKFKI